MFVVRKSFTACLVAAIAMSAGYMLLVNVSPADNTIPSDAVQTKLLEMTKEYKSDPKAPIGEIVKSCLAINPGGTAPDIAVRYGVEFLETTVQFLVFEEGRPIKVISKEDREKGLVVLRALGEKTKAEIVGLAKPEFEATTKFIKSIEDQDRVLINCAAESISVELKKS